MAITAFPDLFYGRIETPSSVNPKLNGAVEATGLVFVSDTALINEDGADPNIPFILILEDSNTGKRMECYVKAGELSADFKTVTLAALTQKGLEPAGQNGVDFASGASSRRFKLNDKSSIRLSVSPLVLQMISDALLANISSKIKFGAAPTWDVTATDVALSNPVYADAATGEAAITSPVNGYKFYATTEGVVRQYIGGAWTNEATGSVANASATVAGKVEIATTAQTIAGTDTGETGASLTALPSDIAANVQNSSYKYAADAEASDTYVITLVPAISAYATGQEFNFKANTANTGAATLNVNAKGAITIKKFHDQDLEDGDIESGSIVKVIYDGTNFQLQTPMATNMTSAEADTLTDGPTSNAALLHAHLKKVGVDSFNPTADTDTKVITHSLGHVPNLIKIIWYNVTTTRESAGKGIYDGTNYATVYYGTTSAPGFSDAATSTTKIIVADQIGAAAGWDATLTTITSTQFTIDVSSWTTATSIVFSWEVE